MISHEVVSVLLLRLLATKHAKADRLRAFHGQLLSDMMARVQKNKGLTDGISADRFHATTPPSVVATAGALKDSKAFEGPDSTETFQ